MTNNGFKIPKHLLKKQKRNKKEKATVKVLRTNQAELNYIKSHPQFKHISTMTNRGTTANLRHGNVWQKQLNGTVKKLPTPVNYTPNPHILRSRTYSQFNALASESPSKTKEYYNSLNVQRHLRRTFPHGYSKGHQSQVQKIENEQHHLKGKILKLFLQNSRYPPIAPKKQTKTPNINKQTPRRLF